MTDNIGRKEVAVSQPAGVTIKIEQRTIAINYPLELLPGYLNWLSFNRLQWTLIEGNILEVHNTWLPSTLKIMEAVLGKP